MTTLAVEAEHRDSLGRQGFAISSWIGFDTHMVPFYTHHDVADKKRGDVVFKARVGNPKTLNSGEATYFARKAAQGYFPWQPGADCLARTFRNIEIRKRPLGGTERIESAPYKGCRWCREQPVSIPVAQEPQPESSSLSPTPVTAAPALPSYDVLHCAKCPAVFIGETAVNERRNHTMRDHHKPSSTVGSKSAPTPAEGSAKE